jgi:glycosyltransferase involved in cell wall biosynthesis
MSLLGWRADVETIYAAADLILLTSDNEGMPVSLIEAALAGVPAVSTNVGSVAEVVQHNATGLLTQCDAGALARGVVQLLRDNALRLRLGAAAGVWSRQQFGPDRLVRDVQHLYEEIALERGWWPDARKLPQAPGSKHAQTLDGVTL